MTALGTPHGTHLRVGEVAAQAGTTPRTIRYYEEIGLLAPAGDRPKGVHRLYTPEDVERVREVVRLRNLLGVSLEELGTLIEVDSVRRQLKDEWAGATDPAERKRILTAALDCAETQLSMIQLRRAQLVELEKEVTTRSGRIRALLREVEEGADPATRG